MNDWSKRSKRWKAAQISALKALYGSEIQRSTPTPSLSTTQVNRRVESNLGASKPTAVLTEDDEQIALVNWLDKHNIPFYHIPNGGRRTLLQGLKFKRLGVKAGVPDICIVVANKTHHGLYIELKRREGGRLSDAQRHWLTLLNKQGYQAIMCEGADEAVAAVTKYLANL